MQKLARTTMAMSLILLLAAWLSPQAKAQEASQTSPVGPIGLDTTNGGGLFVLPNFQGDTREEDSHYNTLHQYPFPAWDTYRQLLYSYAAQARQAASQAWPPPPYSTYDYSAGDMTAGPGGPVPSAVPGTPVFVSGSSGVSVNPNGGAISCVNDQGVATGADAAATATVTGSVITPGLVAN